VIETEIARPEASIACIGLAGENQSRIAAIVNDQGRAAARTGLGAVMGSKRLKAIAVCGNGRPKLFNETVFNTVVREAHDFLKKDILAEMLRLGGTAFFMDIGMMYGDTPHSLLYSRRI